jgi:ribosome-associated protein
VPDPPADDAPNLLRVTPDLAIPLDEIEWRFGPSGGPGGQHANRSNTRAEATFDIVASPSLPDHARQRLLTKVGEVARAASDEHRSQLRNRGAALDRLRSQLAEALREPKHRRKTKPKKAAVERRLDAKRRRSAIKRERRQPGSEW